MNKDSLKLVSGVGEIKDGKSGRIPQFNSHKHPGWKSLPVGSEFINHKGQKVKKTSINELFGDEYDAEENEAQKDRKTKMDERREFIEKYRSQK